jgi:hypothetical protein
MNTPPTPQREIVIRLYDDEHEGPDALRAEAMAIMQGRPLDVVLAIADAPPAPWYEVPGLLDRSDPYCDGCRVYAAADEIWQKLGVALTLDAVQVLQFLAARDYGATLRFIDEQTGLDELGLGVYFPDEPGCDEDLELALVMLSDN